MGEGNDAAGMPTRTDMNRQSIGHAYNRGCIKEHLNDMPLAPSNSLLKSADMQLGWHERHDWHVCGIIGMCGIHTGDMSGLCGMRIASRQIVQVQDPTSVHTLSPQQRKSSLNTPSPLQLKSSLNTPSPLQLKSSLNTLYPLQKAQNIAHLRNTQARTPPVAPT